MLLCLDIGNSVFEKKKKKDSIYPKYADLQIVEVTFGMHFDAWRR
jgi:hypothetical protein